MILISYPSGGFGNFLYHVLTECSSNTYKQHNTNFQFDANGRSHDTKKYTPIWSKDPDDYKVILPNTDKECLILCDNGINNDSYTKINEVFPESSKKIRVVIDGRSRPVIYKTCLIKAQGVDHIDDAHEHVISGWDNTEDFSVRENFTLLYHNWPFKWFPDKDCLNIELSSLITRPNETLTKLINDIGGEVVSTKVLSDICEKWLTTNNTYFSIYHDWKNIENSLDNDQEFDMRHIQDLHDQGYINYCIETKFHVIIPVYDYRYWFNSTTDIKKMLECLK